MLRECDRRRKTEDRSRKLGVGRPETGDGSQKAEVQCQLVQLEIRYSYKVNDHDLPSGLALGRSKIFPKDSILKAGYESILVMRLI